MKKVRKAVFPVAGLGTRFLPATKAVPKEMLTVVDRPVIQYVVDEAREAGIEHFIFVTGRNKAVIEDHFDVQFELNATLAERKKDEPLERLRRMQPDKKCLKAMIDLYGQTGQNIIAVQECDPAEAHKYGIVGRGKDVHNGFEITEMVEKPAKGTAPSNLYINGRYILQPDIFDILESQERGAGNEIQLTDAMLKLEKKQPFYGYHYEGRTFDCGSPEGFIEANVAFSLWRADLHDNMSDVIEKLLGELKPIEGFKG